MNKLYKPFKTFYFAIFLLLSMPPQLSAQNNSGAIGDQTYCDNNNNGVFDTGDTPATGLTITLCDAGFLTLSTQTVDAAGKYLFRNLAEGIYNIKFPEQTSDGKPQRVLAPINVVLKSGEQFLEADKGYFKAASTATSCIGGMTFCDNNNNGVFDTGDVPATGLTVTLCDANFNTLSTQAVDASGKYQFRNLSGGTYNVKFPEKTLDEKPQRILEPINVIIADDQKFLFADKAYFKKAGTATGSIGDQVFCDNNNNGIFDNGDVPATGLTITLCDASFNTLSTQAVDNNGKYLFQNLGAGTYNIKFPEFTTDNKPQRNLGPINVVLAAGQQFLDADKAYYKAPTTPSGSIGDQVFCDNNNNGIFDTGDTPIIGLTITLCDANFLNLSTQVLDNNGKYLFSNLAAGTYNVKFPETTADGKKQRTLGAIKVVLTEGVPFLDADKAYIKIAPAATSSIGGITFYDNNNNGVFDAGEVPINGLTVTLCNANSVPLTTFVTDAFGKYIFRNLEAGSYNIKFPATTGDGVPQRNPGIINVTVGNNQKFLFADKAYYKAPTATLGCIGDLAFCDNNNNGVYDFDDTPATGLTITLCDANFVTLKTQAVDNNGKYLFTNLEAGTYNIKFPEFTVDDKPQRNLGPINVVLAAGQKFLDADKAYYKAPIVNNACIGGLTYHDNNNNGLYDGVDAPIKGLTVTLYDVRFNILKSETVDINGRYSFQNLAAGTYNVKFPETTADGKSQVVAGSVKVVLSAHEKVQHVNKGYYKAPSGPTACIGDLAYCDNNNNGVFDAGDTPATGLTITLCDVNFVTLKTQAVDNNGKYLFTNLEAGTYNIKFPEKTLDGKPQSNLGPINVVLTEGQKFLNADKAYYKEVATEPPFVINADKCYRLTTKNNHYSLTYEEYWPMTQQSFIKYNEMQIFRFEKLYNGTYKIIERSSGKVVALETGGCYEGTTLTIQTYWNRPTQQWHIEPVDNGHFKLISASCSKNVINLGSDKKDWGDVAEMGLYYGKDHQKWKAVEVECSDDCSKDDVKPLIYCPEDITKDVSNLSGSCWSVTYPQPIATDNCCVPTVTMYAGAPSGSCFPSGITTVSFQAKDLKGNTANCSFKINIKSNKPECKTNFTYMKCYRIVNVGSGKVLDIRNGRTYNNMPVIQWPYQSTPSQQLVLYPMGADFYNIMCLSNGRVLGVNALLTGWSCNLYDYYSYCSKLWKISCNSDGTYTILNHNNGKVLDIEGHSTVDGALVQINNYDGSNSQKWRIEEVPCQPFSYYLVNNNVLTMDVAAEPLCTRIDWINNTGFKNDFFVVQKINSKTGDFEDIATINAFKSTEELQHFSVFDNKPTEGDNFYRIKVAYVDGTFGYTDTKKVVFDKLSGVRFYPNPANESVDIDLSKYKGKEVGIYIYNHFGQTLRFHSIDSVGDTPLSMNVSDLTNGQYILRVTCKGRRDETKTLMIAH